MPRTKGLRFAKQLRWIPGASHRHAGGAARAPALFPVRRHATAQGAGRAGAPERRSPHCSDAVLQRACAAHATPSSTNPARAPPAARSPRAAAPARRPDAAALSALAAGSFPVLPTLVNHRIPPGAPHVPAPVITFWLGAGQAVGAAALAAAVPQASERCGARGRRRPLGARRALSACRPFGMGVRVRFDWPPGAALQLISIGGRRAAVGAGGEQTLKRTTALAPLMETRRDGSSIHNG